MTHQTTEPQAKYETETKRAFQSPNYTQTPNDFFALLPDMGDAELRVTLVMVRQTFGFHRDGFKMGIHKLALAAGLSDNGAKTGAEAAEKRGTFRRTNPDAQTEAEWELVVDQPPTPSTTDPLMDKVGQPVTQGGSASDPQVRSKESNKEINKEDDERSKRLSKLSTLYEENIGATYPLLADEFREIADDTSIPIDWFERAFKIAASNNKRFWGYVASCLRNMKLHGANWKPGPPEKGKPHANNPGRSTPVPEITDQQRDKARRIRALQGEPSAAAD